MNKEYVNHPRTDTELKQNIREAIAATLRDMISPLWGTNIPV
jgi:hypothetical protein